MNKATKKIHLFEEATRAANYRGPQSLTMSDGHAAVVESKTDTAAGDVDEPDPSPHLISAAIGMNRLRMADQLGESKTNQRVHDTRISSESCVSSRYHLPHPPSYPYRLGHHPPFLLHRPDMRLPVAGPVLLPAVGHQGFLLTNARTKPSVHTLLGHDPSRTKSFYNQLNTPYNSSVLAAPVDRRRSLPATPPAALMGPSPWRRQHSWPMQQDPYNPSSKTIELDTRDKERTVEAALETLGAQCLERRKNKAPYFDASVLKDPNPSAVANRRTRGGVTEPFPEKLHRMLEDVEKQGQQELISFFSHGRAFGIHKPQRFAEEVMPKYFKQSRLSSFQRQLNLYGFTRINTGPDAGGYYHELFLRGRPNLSIHIRRVGVPQAIPRRRGVKAHDSMADPDFYSMPAINLPASKEEPAITTTALKADESPADGQNKSRGDTQSSHTVYRTS